VTLKKKLIASSYAAKLFLKQDLWSSVSSLHVLFIYLTGQPATNDNLTLTYIVYITIQVIYNIPIIIDKDYKLEV